MEEIKKILKNISENIIVIFIIILLNYTTTIDGYAIEKSGCKHNGTMFADGSIVPSQEPCLNCKCSYRTLICSLRVCPEQPVPPPRGCILIHRKKSCCPHLSCSKYNQNSAGSSNRRIINYHNNYWNNDDGEQIDHDDDSQQRILHENSLFRRIDDGDDGDIDSENDDEQLNSCIHYGTVYKSGSAMSSSTLCSYCYCFNGKQKCIKPKCVLLNNGCMPIFADSTCCPIRYECNNKIINKILSNDIIEMELKKPRVKLKSYANQRHIIENKHYLRTASMKTRKSRGCIIESQFYPEGQKLPNISNRTCEICFCIRGNIKCTPKKCTPIIKNCAPIISDGQCCPSSYDCNNSIEPSPRVLNSNFTSRQFNLFSLIFGEEDRDGKNTTDKTITDDIDYGDENNNYTDSDYFNSPSSSSSSQQIEVTSEKSFFDTLRETLNAIKQDIQDDKENLTISSQNATTTMTTSTTTYEEPLQKTVVEDDDDDDDIDLLDLILGKDENNDYKDDVENYNVQQTSTERLINSHQTIPTDDVEDSSNNNTDKELNIQTTTQTSTIKTTTIKTSNYSNYLDYNENETTSNTEYSDDYTNMDDISTTTNSNDQLLDETTFEALPEESSTTISSTALNTESTVIPNKYTNTITSIIQSSSIKTITESSTIEDIQSKESGVTDEDDHTSSGADVNDENDNNQEIETDDDEDDEDIAEDIEDENDDEEDDNDDDKDDDGGAGLFSSIFDGISKIFSDSTDSYDVEKNKYTTTTTESIVHKTNPIKNQTNQNIKIIHTKITSNSIDYNDTKTIEKEKVNLIGTAVPISTTSVLPTTTTTEAATTKIQQYSNTIIDNDLTTIAPTSLAITTSNKPTNSTIIHTTTTAPASTIRTPQTITTTSTASATVTTIITPKTTEKSTTTENPIDKISITTLRNIDEGGVLTETPVKKQTIIIDSNPSILESDINYDYSEPTLPPSLPNLKIIPFLPSDALKNDDKKFNYYKSKPLSLGALLADSYHNANNPRETQPSIGTSSSSATASEQNIGSDQNHSIYPQSSMSMDNHNNKYPVYSAKYNAGIIQNVPVSADYEYDSYNVQSSNNAPVDEEEHHHDDNIKYIHSGNIEHDQNENYGIGSYANPFVQYSGKNVYSKIDFVNTENPTFERNNQFSPPSKTEGGFIPREPSKSDYAFNQYQQTTNFNIDLTTQSTLVNNNLSNLIITADVTTITNPFKDVIRTETPPDLHLLIEDKEKLLSQQHKKHFSYQNKMPYKVIFTNDKIIDHDDIDEQNIISITTDINYNKTLDYIDDTTSKNNIILRNTKKPSLSTSVVLPLSYTTTKYNTKNDVSVELNKYGFPISPDPPSSSSPMQHIHNFANNGHLNGDNTNKNGDEDDDADNDDDDADEEENLFGNIFGFLFKDDKIKATMKPPMKEINNFKIPPFKNLSNDTNEKLKIIEENIKSNGSPQRINDKITEIPAITNASGSQFSYQSITNNPILLTESPSLISDIINNSNNNINKRINQTPTDVPPMKVDNLNILRDVLLATLHNPNPSFLNSDQKNTYLSSSSSATQSASSSSSTISALTPLQQKLSFLKPSFPIGKPQPNAITTNHYEPIRSDLDLIIPTKYNQLLLNTDHELSNTESYVINPVDLEQLKKHQQTMANTNQLHTASILNDNINSNSKNNFIVEQSTSTVDSSGILKLAGCNIYGRMYRVGRIISELSGPCLECKCTNIGVHCTPLTC